MQFRPFAPALTLALVLGLAACAAPRRPPPPLSPEPAAARPGLVPVHGEWSADKTVNLRAAPSTGSAVVGRLSAGQPVTVLGRAPKTDWIAVSHHGGTAYVRLDLLRLRGDHPPTARGTSSVVAKPVDNAGPAIKAAPRGKISASPIS